MERAAARLSTSAYIVEGRFKPVEMVFSGLLLVFRVDVFDDREVAQA